MVRNRLITDRDGAVRMSSTEVDFGMTEPGDIVMIRTENSTWWLTLTTLSDVTETMVTGVFIQTDSKTFGQAKLSPNSYRLRRVFRLNEPIMRSNGSRLTSRVKAIWVNGAVCVAFGPI